jgi:hypothetical protein
VVDGRQALITGKGLAVDPIFKLGKKLLVLRYPGVGLDFDSIHHD